MVKYELKKIRHFPIAFMSANNTTIQSNIQKTFLIDNKPILDSENYQNPIIAELEA